MHSQHLYMSLAIDIELCLSHLRLLLPADLGRLIDFFAIRGWKIAGMARIESFTIL